MPILLATSIIFCALALWFFVHMLRHTRRRRFVRAGGSCISCIASLAIGLVACLLMYTYISYSRLTAETVVSTISFRQTGIDQFEARLMIVGKTDRLFTLRGDEWQMDARVVSWTPPATILGLDPVYRLERLSGRYSDIDREKNEQRTVHALSANTVVDIWALARRIPTFLPGIDAYYGSATYVPMADGARFEVSLSRDALIARPENDAARSALGRWKQSRTGDT